MHTKQDVDDMSQPQHTRVEPEPKISFKHLFKLFLFYLFIISLVVGWVVFRHYEVVNIGTMIGLTFFLAAASTIAHWFTGRYSKIDDIVEGNIPITEISLIATFVLSIIGIGVTDYSPAKSYQYWGAMTVVLTIAALFIGWARAEHLKRTVTNIFITQIVHWTATWVAVFGIFLLLNAGRLNYESTGLALLVVLGLATFLDGYRVSWRLSIVGILMFVTSLIAAYLEQYLWVLLIFATITFIMAYFWSRHRRNKRQASLEADV